MDPRAFLAEYLGDTYIELLPQWHVRLTLIGVKAGVDEAEANDLAATAIARALECLDRFSPAKAGPNKGEGLRRWLQGIHLNVLRDHLDKVRRRKGYSLDSTPSDDGQGPAAEPVAPISPSATSIVTLLDVLPNERLRQMAKLLAGGKSKSEIAKDLGVSKARISQMAGEMRQYLGSFNGTEND